MVSLFFNIIAPTLYYFNYYAIKKSCFVILYCIKMDIDFNKLSSSIISVSLEKKAGVILFLLLLCTGKREGYNALLWGAEKNNTELVRMLIEEFDSNVNHQSASG